MSLMLQVKKRYTKCTAENDPLLVDASFSVRLFETFSAVSLTFSLEPHLESAKQTDIHSHAALTHHSKNNNKLSIHMNAVT